MGTYCILKVFYMIVFEVEVCFCGTGKKYIYLYKFLGMGKKKKKRNECGWNKEYVHLIHHVHWQNMKRTFDKTLRSWGWSRLIATGQLLWICGHMTTVGNISVMILNAQYSTKRIRAELQNSGHWADRTWGRKMNKNSTDSSIFCFLQLQHPLSPGQVVHLLKSFNLREK